MKIRASSVSRSVRRRHLAALCAPLGLAVAPAFAQQQMVKVSPSVRLTETVTDNVRLEKSDTAMSDWITQIAPSVRVDAQGRRVNGSLNVGVTSSIYANDSSAQRNQLMLNGSGKIEAWENHGFVDVLGSISRQPTYAFRSHSGDTVTGTNNMTEVKVFSVSPYLKGRFGSTGSVEARYSLSQTDSDSTTVFRTQSQIWSVNATDPRASGNLGWAFNFRDSHTETVNRRDLNQQTTRLTGMVQVDPQLVLRLIAGGESNNFSASGNRSSTIYGAGADWNPTPRTKVSATVEDRFFGPGYSLSAEHRSVDLAFQGSYTKDVSSTSQSMLGAVSLYDLLMLQYSAAFPDVATRSAFVRRLIDAYAPGMGGAIVGAQSVLTNGYFLDRRFQLGMTLIGARNSIAFIGFRSERDSLTDRFAVTGDVSTSRGIVSTGATITLNHRLTSMTSANLALTSIRNQTTDASLAVPMDSRTRLINAGLMTSFTPKTTGSLNLRTNRGSGSNQYSENAVLGSVAIQF